MISKKVSMLFLALLVVAIFMVVMLRAPAAGQLPQPEKELAHAVRQGFRDQVERIIASHDISMQTLKGGLWLAIHQGHVDLVEGILEKHAFALEFADHGTLKAALERARYLLMRGEKIGYFEKDENKLIPKEYQFIPTEVSLKQIIDILEKYLQDLGIEKPRFLRGNS